MIPCYLGGNKKDNRTGKWGTEGCNLILKFSKKGRDSTGIKAVTLQKVEMA